MSPATGSRRNQNSILQLAWTRYKGSLARRPLVTKAVTSACVASLSDVVAQKLIGGKYSFARTLKMAMWGLLFGAPSAHYWHQLLQRISGGKSDTLAAALRKVILDQLTFGPLYNFCFMAYTSMVVHGMPAVAFQRKAVREYPALQLNGWKVWLPVGLINYRYIPLQFRVLFANVVAFFWSVFVILGTRVPKNTTGKTP